jgi:hypothetical protein
MKRNVLLGFILFLGTGLFGQNAAQAAINWATDPGGYLTVNNNVNEPLVLFAGTINNWHLLGGVRARDFRRIDFFGQMEDTSGVFLLRAVKESAYRSKGSSLGSDDVIFAGLVAFDKGDPRAIWVDINQTVGGEACILFSNDTIMALQIRLDRPDGPALTTLAPFEHNKKIYMEPNQDGCLIFPVYVYYDRASRDIRHVTSGSMADGVPIMPVVPGPGRDIAVINFAAAPSRLFSPFAYLVVSNWTSRGVSLLEGSNRLATQNGTTVIEPGLETCELYLQKQPRLRIGGLSVDLLAPGAAGTIRIPEYDYEAGCAYRVLIQQGATPEVIGYGKLDTDDFSIQLVNER